MSQEDIQTENEAPEEQTVVEESSPSEEKDTSQPSRRVEESQTEDVEESSQTREASEEESKEEPRTKNAQSRIKELLAENRRLKAQPESQQQQSLQYPSYEGVEEVSREQLERDVAQTANALVDLKLQPYLDQMERQQQEADIASIESKYEVLNPSSDNYDPDLDAAIAEAYQEFGTSAGLKAFVDKQMALIDKRATKVASSTTEAVNRQADDQAIRPGSPRQEKPFEELSEKEMEERLGLVR